MASLKSLGWNRPDIPFIAPQRMKAPHRLWPVLMAVTVSRVAVEVHARCVPRRSAQADMRLTDRIGVV